jgi:hydroxyacylglutathione hydrolase
MTHTASIRIRPIEAFSDNYIWLIEDGTHAVVVDPGDALPVLDELETCDLELTAILLTHHHHDHVGGVLELLQTFNAKVYGPAHETLPACDVRLGQQDQVDIAQPALSFTVLDVPGHTAGHIAYTGNVQGQPVLFCGDTLFVGGCGRLFEGTPAQMLDSLDKLAQLEPETKVYCAHEYTLANLRWARAVEPQNSELATLQTKCQAARDKDQPTVPSTVGVELACNPFMRARQSTVAAAARQWSGDPLPTPVDVFAAVRQWKNNFK